MIINNISQEQLAAISLQAPVVADGEYTDRVISIRMGNSTEPVRARVLQCLADPVSGNTIYFLRTGINNIITKSQGEVELAIDGRPPPGNDENTTTGDDTAGNDSNGPWHPPGGSTGDARNLPPRAQFSPLATFQNLKFLLPESFPAADFANLQKLEELAQVLCTEVSGQLPVDAVTPRESAEARLSWAATPSSASTRCSTAWRACAAPLHRASSAWASGRGSSGRASTPYTPSRMRRAQTW